MKFRIDDKVLDKFPEIALGLLVVKGINNQGDDREIQELLKKQKQEITQKFQKDQLGENPRLKPWREAFSSFGAKPKKYKCSVENLYRMILEGVELNNINNLVDIYNYISLKYMVPAGGDDIDKVDGFIELAISEGKEPFQQLNSEEVKNPKEGEVIYRDNTDVLCRRWNWRECNKSKMTEQTKNAALVIECLPPLTAKHAGFIIKELQDLVQKHLGGESKTYILNKDNKEAEI